MKSTFLTNPFYAYIVSFVAVIVLYSLPYCELYMPLSRDLIFFFLFSFLLYGFIGYKIQKKDSFVVIPQERKYCFKIFIIFCAVLADFTYCRSIPLFDLLRGSGRYKDFLGIPFFHVVILFYVNFYTIYLFHNYLIYKKKLMLWGYMMLLFVNILYVNRGALILVILCTLILYLKKNPRINLSLLVKLFLGGILFFWVFGLIGNIRESQSREDDTYILRIGGASQEYIDTGLPNELYWGYLYIVSPLGNLQNIISKKIVNDSEYSSYDCIVDSFLPDFLAKRLKGSSTVDTNKYLVVEALNASTIFYQIYYGLGWLGMFLMLFYSVGIYFLFAKVVGYSSRYYLTGESVIVSTFLLSFFNNMWYYTSLSILLLIVCLSILKRLKI